MPTPTKPYPRRTRTICIGIDQDAHDLLMAMVPPSHVGMGQLVSEWVRKEAAWRLARSEDLERLRQLQAVYEGARSGGETVD